MTALVRSQIGACSLSHSYRLDDLTAGNWRSCALSPVAATTHLARHVCTAAEARELAHGRELRSPSLAQATAEDEVVAFLNETQQLLALGRRAPGSDGFRPKQVYPPASAYRV